MRSSSPFGGRTWFQPSSEHSQPTGRRGIEDRLKRHNAALLTNASMSSDATRVKELLAAGADPNVSDDKGRLPLHAAAFSGATEVLRHLLEARADPNLLEQGQDGGSVALQIAAWQGHTETARLLLEHSADVEALDERCWSPLCSAAFQGHASICRLLLTHGSDPSRAVTVAGQGSLTPLRAAAKGGNVGVAAVLKEALASAPPPQQPGGPSRLLQLAAEKVQQSQNLPMALLGSPPGSPRRTSPPGSPRSPNRPQSLLGKISTFLVPFGCGCLQDK
mmetsp:Transcript_81206/g.143197  ORF Transcript_81206/g.143197 Transcript_81206/m.143197 type:complete len:277 (-) Transcript_81206:242-1072(-)